MVKLFSSRLGKYEVWYENSDEFYELKKEIFSENCYYLELDKEDPVIVDAGAHIGMASLYFKMLFPKARVIAIEPIPDNFRILEKNIRENQLENVELFQAALAPKPGILSIQKPTGEGAWKSGAGIIPRGWKGIQAGVGISVAAMGVKDLLTEQLDLVKMDIEGMEYEVIHNAGPALRNSKHWIIEVHPRKDHRLAEIEKILLQNGFKIEVHKDESSLGRGLTTITATLRS